jgi:hypothetical protein
MFLLISYVEEKAKNEYIRENYEIYCNNIDNF